MSRRPNILLITADQWRGDCLGTAGHPVVRTPNLDAFAEKATVFERHYATCAPCSPARASLYTGLYQMNHRVVWNGAPLDNRFDNIARAARRSGYVPTLFGYTDTSPDPRVHDPNDPVLTTYEGVLPGFAVRQMLPEDDKPWLSWLADRGHDRAAFDAIHNAPAEDGQRVSLEPPSYSSEETQTAFLTNSFLSWLKEQEADAPWFAHVSFLRPHPPVVVPEPYNRMHDPEDGPDFLGACSPDEEAASHPFVRAFQAYQRLSSHLPGESGLARDLSRNDFRRLRALYFGMITEVDAQLGRLFAGIEESGAGEDTLIIFTSDHAEMMGDHWMLGKGGFHEQSYHIPLIVRAPGAARGNRVRAFTSAVDIFPTLLDLLDLLPAHEPDGVSLRPYLDGQTPVSWRNAALWEYDFRAFKTKPEGLPETTGKGDTSLIVHRGEDWQYVHFAALPPLLFKVEDGRAGGPDLCASDEFRPVAQRCVSDLLSDRLRLADNTLARQMVWDHAAEQKGR
jgi:arylsulfatase A-like enzyme